MRAQEFAPKKHYLIDSIELSTYSVSDSALLENSLQKYHTAKTNSDKIKALNSICDQMMHDDWERYQFFQLELIKKSISANPSSKEMTSLKGSLAGAYSNVGYILKLRGDIESALSYYDSAVVLLERNGDKSRMAQTLNNIGVIQKNKGNVPLALEYYHKALKIQEELNDTLGVASSYFNIGAVHQSADDLDLALDYYNRALEVNKKIGSQRGISNSYNNIGAVYREKQDLSEALKYFKRSLGIKQKIGDNKGLIDAHINVGGVYEQLGKVGLAFENYQSALSISEKMSNAKGIANSKINLAKLKLSLNDLSGDEGALALAGDGLKIAEEIGFPSLIRDASEVLYKVYEAKGDYTASLKMHKLFIQMRDSVSNIENQRVLSRRQAQYEYETQKAIDDKEHEKELALEVEEKEKQQIIIYASSFGLLLVIFFLFYAYKRLQITKRQKRTIEVQKDEIVDSINYAKRLQQAILPKEKELFNSLGDGFVLYLPKDIVAGDFYWTFETSDYKFIAAADCTGHGVPGAMVSVVCATALDRAVTEFSLTETNEILDKTTELVIETFEKSGEDVKDGMDISLARIDKSNKELQFSGAHNPLWIISSENDIAIIKGDRQPVGKLDNRKPFNKQTVRLEPGDWVFQFTDGYVDQFGGEKGKKYRASNLKNKLLSIQSKDSHVIQKELELEFQEWKGEEEQIDDVCILGWKVGD